jgi:hypothetical protein
MIRVSQHNASYNALAGLLIAALMLITSCATCLVPDSLRHLCCNPEPREYVRIESGRSTECMLRGSPMAFDREDIHASAPLPIEIRLMAGYAVGTAPPLQRTILPGVFVPSYLNNCALLI